MANEDKSARYHRLRRRASLVSAILAAAFLILLLMSGGVQFQAGNRLAQAARKLIVRSEAGAGNGPALMRRHGPFDAQGRMLRANDNY